MKVLEAEIILWILGMRCVVSFVDNCAIWVENNISFHHYIMIFNLWLSYLHFFLLGLITKVTLNSEFFLQFEDPGTEGDTAVITCKIGYANNV